MNSGFVYYHNKPSVIVHGIDFTNGNLKLSGSVEIFKRNGTCSPELHIYIINGKRYPPVACRKYGIFLTFNGLFKIVYRQNLDFIIPPEPFYLQHIILDEEPSSYSPYINPFLGKIHGIIND